MRTRSSVMLLIAGLIILIWVILHLETKMHFPSHQQSGAINAATQASAQQYGR